MPAKTLYSYYVAYRSLWQIFFNISSDDFLSRIPVFISIGIFTWPLWSHLVLIQALIAGLIVGALAQRTRLCMVGGIRDLILFKDWYLISGFIAIFAAALIGNAVFGFVKIGFMEQPVAHTDWLWNFLGMALAGFGSVLLGGCPLRQLILSGEGNIDSVMAVLGMVFGAAFAHNFQLASSAKGPTLNGKIAVIIGFILVAAIAYFNRERSVDIKVKGDVKLEG